MSDGRVQLGDVDLNLLVHLHELLERASVTEAANHLGVTQSAMSHTLKRLRALFDDKLLVRGRRGMIRTPRAEALRDPLYRSLLALQDTLVNHKRFVPAESSRRFRLVMSDYMQIVILPQVIELLSREAPGVELQVESLVDPAGIIDRLLSGEIDLATSGPLLEGKPEVAREVLLVDRLRCAVRRDHPQINDQLSLGDYVTFPHILISPSGRGLSIVDEALSSRGERRFVSVRVQSFLSAPFLLSASDSLLTAPERVLQIYAEPLRLRLLEPPVELERFELALLWSERERHNAALTWLRAAFTRACQELP